MMTKEEVASVVSYCNEHNITFKQRLNELGVTEGSFYRAKYKYFTSEYGKATSGSFLKLTPGTFSQVPEMNRHTKCKKPSSQSESHVQSR